jgi:hypothetical protein
MGRSGMHPYLLEGAALKVVRARLHPVAVWFNEKFDCEDEDGPWKPGDG